MTKHAPPADTNNRIVGFCYDAAGDLLAQSALPCPAPTYTYDAENRVKTTAGVTYTYDGDGNRIQKSNGKLYWYGSGSVILDESDATGIITNEYIFFGGKRLARRVVSSGQIQYYFADHLGSSRVVTDASGNILDDADFYPFGGERTYTSTSGNAYKFTGQERDTETGNDDFGARYYSNRFGRWLSADWSNVPVPVPYANLTNPQTLNLYSMVADDPESFADLDGHLNNGNCADGNSSCPGGTQQTQDQNRSAADTNANQNANQIIGQQMSQMISDSYRGPEASVLAGIEKELWNTIAGIINAKVSLGGLEQHAAQAPILEGSNTTEKIAMVGTAVALVVAPIAVEAGAGEAALTGVRANRAAGNAFRDEVANSLKAAGRDVQTEVTKPTPFGRRVIDIEVKHNGKTLGGVETKTGRSRYKASQRAKDAYLKQKGYPVNVVRKPSD